MTKPNVFVSDLGLRDESVYGCASVLAPVAPASRVINVAQVGVVRYEASAAEQLGVRTGDPVWTVPAD